MNLKKNNDQEFFFSFGASKNQIERIENS
jgi:hypothetical protein